jgi:integrase
MWHIVSFAIATAMRLSEIMRIRLGGRDWEDRTLLIRDRKHPNQKKGNNQLIPLLEGCSTLCDGAAECVGYNPKAERKPRGTGKNTMPSGRVFPYPPHSISVMFRQTCAELKIVDLHFHDLRHEGVSRLFEAGYTIEQVALVSGHKDWKQLRRYTNIKATSLHRN